MYAVETLLVHEKVKDEFLPIALKALHNASVKLH